MKKIWKKNWNWNFEKTTNYFFSIFFLNQSLDRVWFENDKIFEKLKIRKILSKIKIFGKKKFFLKRSEINAISSLIIWLFFDFFLSLIIRDKKSGRFFDILKESHHFFRKKSKKSQIIREEFFLSLIIYFLIKKVIEK